MLISQIGGILDAIEKYHDEDISLFELAAALDMPVDKLQTFLSWNNVIDGNNRPQPWINYQDIVNLITLYFAMKPTHEFKFTVFGDKNDGYAEAKVERITVQPFRKPNPTRQGGRKPPV